MSTGTAGPLLVVRLASSEFDLAAPLRLLSVETREPVDDLDHVGRAAPRTGWPDHAKSASPAALSSSRSEG
jgi:hypothetical protein